MLTNHQFVRHLESKKLDLILIIRIYSMPFFGLWLRLYKKIKKLFQLFHNCPISLPIFNSNITLKWSGRGDESYLPFGEDSVKYRVITCCFYKLTCSFFVFMNFSVKYVQIHGIEYRPGRAIRIADMDEVGECDYLTYGKLKEIIVWNNEKFFVVIVLRETLEFNSHLMSYKIVTTKQKVVCQQSLP